MNDQLQGAIALAIITLVPILALWVRAYIKAKFTPSALATASAAASTAVQAAEVMGKVASAPGSTKLEWARESLAAFTKRLGLNLSEAELDALIHAALDETITPEHVQNAALQGYQQGLQEGMTAQPLDVAEVSA